MAESKNLKAIRRVWRAYEREGLTAGAEALLEIAAPDVVIAPFTAGGRVIHGEDEYRAHIAANAADDRTRFEARAHRFEEEGDTVVVAGGIRVFEAGGFSETTVRWEYEFREGLLVRAGAG